MLLVCYNEGIVTAGQGQELVRQEAEEEERRVYLSVVQGYRGEDGKTKTSHVRSLGTSTSSRRLYDDPVAHFRAEVEAENEAARAEAAPITVTLHPLQRIDKRAEGRIDMGAAVPSAYFHRELGIRDFFERRRTSRGFSYDPCRILELLTWNRVSEPGSKAAAFASRGRFPAGAASRSTTCTAASTTSPPTPTGWSST